MATCLRCDNCSKTATEQEGTLPSWWSLERYGMEWVDEPGRSSKSSSKMFASAPSVLVVDGSGMMIDDDEDDDDDGVMVLGFEGFGPVDVTLHFCSATCLGSWAKEAESFEKS